MTPAADSVTRARQVREMMVTPGYEIVADYMRDRIDRLNKTLARTPFSNMLEVGKAQGELKAFEDLRNHLTSVVKQGEREAQTDAD